MMMNSLRVVFMGTPVFAVNILEGLIENYNVVGVVSQPDRKIGRKQVLVNTPVKECALKHDILVFQPSNIKEDYKDILDLTFTLYGVYLDAPYEGYKIEEGNLYYVNSDSDNEQFECGEEVKVTLNNNKYTLSKTRNTYKNGAGQKCI